MPKLVFSEKDIIYLKSEDGRRVFKYQDKVYKSNEYCLDFKHILEEATDSEVKFFNEYLMHKFPGQGEDSLARRLQAHEFVSPSSWGQCVVMEMPFIEGKNLYRACRGVDRDKAKRMLLNVLQEVILIGRLDLVHRDFKCDNLLVNPDGRVVVIDFEFSVRLDTEHSYSCFGDPDLKKTSTHLPSHSVASSVGRYAPSKLDDLYAMLDAFSSRIMKVVALEEKLSNCFKQIQKELTKYLSDSDGLNCRQINFSDRKAKYQQWVRRLDTMLKPDVVDNPEAGAALVGGGGYAAAACQDSEEFSKASLFSPLYQQSQRDRHAYNIDRQTGAALDGYFQSVVPDSSCCVVS